MPLPRVRAASGRRLGPRTSRAIATTKAMWTGLISVMQAPTLAGTAADQPRLRCGQHARLKTAHPLEQVAALGAAAELERALAGRQAVADAVGARQGVGEPHPRRQ